MSVTLLHKTYIYPPNMSKIFNTCKPNYAMSMILYGIAKYNLPTPPTTLRPEYLIYIYALVPGVGQHHLQLVPQSKVHGV